MRETKKNGFTLIEIIIALFIIGLIITLANISINRIKEKGRDIKRIDNIKQIQLALEIYRRDVGSYPETITFGGELTNPTNPNIIYLNEIPTNLPYKNNENCLDEEYTYSTEDGFYLIDFCLERPTENYALGHNCAKTEGIYDGRCFQCGTLLSYQEENYNTVQIGNQCWMAKNLNSGTMINSTVLQLNNDNIEKYCPNNIEDNCDIYGGLYQWNEMMGYSTEEGSQGICPTGWHLPTDNEWTELTRYVIDDPSCDTSSGCPPSGEKIKASPEDTPPWNGTNDFNFSALPAGFCNNLGVFYSPGTRAHFWSSTIKTFSTVPIQINIHSTHNEIDFDTADFNWSFSVRCIKN